MIKTLRLPRAKTADPQRERVPWYARKQWLDLSKQWMDRYPVCVLCLMRGQINRGASEERSTRQRNLIVDHIEPHRGDRDRFHDQGNLQTLCRCPCHDVDKQRHEAAGKTGEQWLEYLRSEMERTGSHEVVRELWGLLPEGVRRGVSPAHLGAAQGGVVFQGR